MNNTIEQFYLHDLTALPNFVNWKYTQPDRNGKRKKRPINPANLGPASHSDPATWSLWDRAEYQYCNNRWVDGIGFVFSHESGLYNGLIPVGIDIDDCIDGGNIHPQALRVMEIVPGYAELSPSGQGIHILALCDVAQIEDQFDKLYVNKAFHALHIEMYSKERYFTLSGRYIQGSRLYLPDCTDGVLDLYSKVKVHGHPPTGAYKNAAEHRYLPENSNLHPPTQKNTAFSPLGFPTDREIIAKAETGHDGVEFQALMQGKQFVDDNSTNDWKLVRKLAFYSGGNAELMDQIFRQSGLMRDKWDRRYGQDNLTYGEKTIRNAIARQRGKFYDWSKANIAG